ncbi:ROK family transcriptional regulator [Palleronia caenipelagi]|uniref:ROK family protein n=1 Tax=Palleronia caenipelagi TaxID=2489174 RepID=A0A547Q855_9RHOB|nr:ROK family transcriptional regulator [Palleronia caenipelagi]TRD22567.1 ROK family protein [Palleronia caenipelagi]
MAPSEHSLNRNAQDATLRGTNQSGVRDHNERLVLSLLRRDGALAKAEIARATGLSAQTVSVITRSLEDEGIILRDAPRRGRIGQPSVPMRLNPDGAYFHGVTVGRRHSEHLLVNMVGDVISRHRFLHPYPDYDDIFGFIRSAAHDIHQGLSDDARGRVAGLGIALPGAMWEWAEHLGVTSDALAPWRTRDLATDVAAALDMDVDVRNDASCACAGELVFGSIPDMPPAMLHIFIDYFIGAGLVLDGQLFTGRTGNAGAIGPMRIPQADGRTRPLLAVSSLFMLADRLETAGKDTSALWRMPPEWTDAEPQLSDWITEIAPGMAHAISVVASVLDIEMVVIDGHMPEEVRQRIVAHVDRAADGINFTGSLRPEIRAGTVGPDARSLGAAALPLAQRFML